MSLLDTLSKLVGKRNTTYAQQRDPGEELCRPEPIEIPTNIPPVKIKNMAEALRVIDRARHAERERNDEARADLERAKARIIADGLKEVVKMPVLPESFHGTYKGIPGTFFVYVSSHSKYVNHAGLERAIKLATAVPVGQVPGPAIPEGLKPGDRDQDGQVIADIGPDGNVIGGWVTVDVLFAPLLANGLTVRHLGHSLYMDGEDLKRVEMWPEGKPWPGTTVAHTLHDVEGT